MVSPSQSNIVRPNESTIFILGNGPSLKGIDLTSLSGFSTIGMNAAYRYWRQINWRPTYYACLDLEVGLSHKTQIIELIEEGRIEAFLLRANLIDQLGSLAPSSRLINFDALRAQNSLMDPPAVTTGSHAALWAGEMGYKRLVIVGVDGRYVEFVSGAERRGGIALEIVREAENPNYFFDDYQQPGDRYNIPNPRPNVHLGAWHDAGLKLRCAGLEVYNASPQSSIGYFPFIDFDDFLGEGSEVLLPSEAMAKEPVGTGLRPSAAKVIPKVEESGKERLRVFLKTQKFGLTLGAVPLAFTLLLTLIQVRFQLAGSIAAVIGIGFLFAMFVIILYTRFVVSRQFDAQALKLNSIEARIQDLERLR